MFKTVIFLIIGINAACQGRLLSRSFIDSRILGGVQVHISEIPYQISLYVNGRHNCGGVLIAKNIILTAAHCTYEYPVTSLTARLGSSERNEGGRLVEVNKILEHPKYDDDTMDYDFAVLILANYDSTNLTVSIVKLPQQNELVDDGLIVQASGWGLTSNSEESDNYLRAVNVSIVNQDICNEKHQNNHPITERMICAGGGGKDACGGDSGGPLTLNNMLVGIVSWGEPCEPYGSYIPGVYARVSAVRDWIKEISGV